MPDTRPFPSWRRIESVLIELLREEGFELEYHKGETTITIVLDEDGLETATINLGDFARQLEERL